MAFFRGAWKPLYVSQAAASAAGSLTVILGAWNMPPGQFAAFSLLILVLNTVIGLSRSGLLQPVLIERRNDPDAVVPARYFILTVFVTVPVGLAALLLGPLSLGDAVLVATLTVAPILHDWLRFRCIGAARNNLVALSDFARLALSPAVLFGSNFDRPAVWFYLIWCCGYLVASIPLMVPYKRAVRYTPYSAYGRRARSQGYEFLIAQLATTVPLLLIGSLANATPIGSFRLAQTLFGPLNVFFSALTLNLLSDAVAATHKMTDISLVQRAWRVSWSALGLALLLTLCLVVGVHAGVLSPSGVVMSEFTVALLSVGLFAALGGFIGPHLVTLRLFGAQQVITRARAVMVSLVWLGFLAGFGFGGPLLSLALGFSAGAVAYGVAFLPVIVRQYRRFG
jgi:hypothetical protein